VIRIRAIDRRGYAQALFLIVLTLLTSLTLLVLSAVDGDLKASHDDVALAQARALAETGLEEFDSTILQTSSTEATLNQLLQRPALQDNSATLPALATYHRWSTYQPQGSGLVNRSGGSATGTAQACTDNAGRADYTRDCFYIDLDPATTTNNLGVGQSTTEAPMVLITVISRTRCAGSAEGCTYASLQQRVRNRQLFNYLFYTQFDALDPSLYNGSGNTANLTAAQANAACANRYAERQLNTAPSSADRDDYAAALAGGGTAAPRDPQCLEVAYQADPSGYGDVVRGPVFTNDDRIVVCGSPAFTDPVTVAGSGASSNSRKFWASAKAVRATSSDVGCNNSRPVDYTSLQQNPTSPALAGEASGRACAPVDCTLRLPAKSVSGPAVRVATLPQYQLTPVTAGRPVDILIKAPAAGSATSTMTISNARDATGATVSQADIPLPSNYLVYVNGDVRISNGATSTLAGKLNVYAEGNLTVAGDVRYCARGASLTNACDTSAVTATGFKTRVAKLDADTTDLLVLMAGGSIQFTKPDVTGATAGQTQRELDALIVSLERAVWVQEWSTAQSWAGDASPNPVLHFYGAMAAKYQGVFGSYNSAFAGITAGYHKDFYFDKRLRNNLIALPYYPLSPGESNWVRVDTSDVPPRLACAQASRGLAQPLCPSAVSAGAAPTGSGSGAIAPSSAPGPGTTAPTTPTTAAPTMPTTSAPTGVTTRTPVG
jgi:hypothetical protein